MQQPGATPYPRTTDMAEMARRCYPDTLGFYRYWAEAPDAGDRPMPMRQARSIRWR